MDEWKPLRAGHDLAADQDEADAAGGGAVTADLRTNMARRGKCSRGGSVRGPADGHGVGQRPVGK